MLKGDSFTQVKTNKLNKEGNKLLGLLILQEILTSYAIIYSSKRWWEYLN